MATIRLTTAQAIVRFLKNQCSRRDGQEFPFFAGILGIFGHGNVAGIGQALQENPDFPFILLRNGVFANWARATSTLGRSRPN